MKVKVFACPQCDKIIDLRVNNPNGYCPFCGKAYYFNDDVKRKHIVRENHYYDEARLMQLSLNEQARERDEKRQDKRFIVNIITIFSGLILLLMVGAYLYFTWKKLYAEILISILALALAILFFYLEHKASSEGMGIRDKNGPEFMLFGLCIIFGLFAYWGFKYISFAEQQEEQMVNEELDGKNDNVIDGDKMYLKGFIHDYYNITSDAVDIYWEDNNMYISFEIECKENPDEYIEGKLKEEKKLFKEWSFKYGYIDIDGYQARFKPNGDAVEIELDNEINDILKMQPGEVKGVQLEMPDISSQGRYELLTSDKLTFNVSLIYEMNDRKGTECKID